MQHIARNPYYEIVFDQQKNRVYLTIIGFWGSINVVPNYLNDWKETLKLVKPGFTVLSDAARMKTHPPEVRLLHETAQMLLMQAGLHQVAKVCPTDDIADLQSDTMVRHTGMPMVKFTDFEEAEAWLDRIQIQYPVSVT